MAKKKQHISLTGPVSWNIIHVYLSGELSDKEMYNLERKIQNEPFEQEALDGFYDHAPASMEKDLEELRDKIQRKTGNRLKEKKPVAIDINWRMVALVAALLIAIIIVVVLFSRRGGDTEQPVQDEREVHASMTEWDDKPDSETTVVFADKDSSATEDKASKESTPSEKPQKKATVKVKTQAPNEVELGALETKNDPSDLFMDENSRIESNDTSVKDIAGNVGIVEPHNIPDQMKSEAISAQTKQTTSQQAEVERELLSRTPALAPGGLEGYKAYLKSQLLISNGNLKGSYKLRLNISEMGSVEDVEVLEGISRRIDKRLVKIIENAPAWSAAHENGKNISDTATFSLSLE